MKNIIKLLTNIITTLFCLAFAIFLIAGSIFMLRFLDVFFLKEYILVPSDVQLTNYITGFSAYRDFVTVITGLLTLIIGATGIGAFFSFKKLKEEEHRLKDSNAKFEELLQFDGERVGLDLESDPDALISILEGKNIDSDAFSLLKAEAYLLRGQDGDYLVAKDLYKKLVEKKPTSGKECFGLGRSKFKYVTKNTSDTHQRTKDLNLDNVSKFQLIDCKQQMPDADIRVVEDAIQNIEIAISCSYNKANALFEQGNMYASIGDDKKALEQYKNSYDLNKNNVKNGFFYAHQWLRMNAKSFSEEGTTESIDDVVKILKDVGMKCLYNHKAAYAFLWYIYSVHPKLRNEDSAKKALAATNHFQIEELFEIPENEELIC